MRQCQLVSPQEKYFFQNTSEWEIILISTEEKKDERAGLKTDKVIIFIIKTNRYG